MVEWVARMVTPAVDLVAPVFRRTVDLDRGTVASAVLHVSSLGVHECFIDGVPVSPEVLSPGWRAYEWRLRYRSHDVTPLLRDGSVLTVALGNGWWRGRLGFLGGRALYGDRLGLIAQLEVTYADGHAQVIGTDASWTAGAVGHHRRRPLRRPDHRRAAAPPGSNTAGVGRPVPGRRTRGVRHLGAGAGHRSPGGASRDEATGADLALTVRGDARRLRPEPGGLAAVHRAGAARLGDPDPARGGAGGRRARRTSAA